MCSQPCKIPVNKESEYWGEARLCPWGHWASLPIVT